MKEKIKANKIFLILVCVASLFISGISGTVAYQTVKDTRTNVIVIGTSGNIQARLDESPVDELGNIIEGPRRLHNSYKLIPGRTYVKDPVIAVTGGSACYLFVRVINELDGYELEENTIASQITANGWTLFDSDKGIYVRTCPGSGNSYQFFSSFTVDKEADVSFFEGKIELQAYAVESADYPTTESAWNAVIAEVPEAAL